MPDGKITFDTTIDNTGIEKGLRLIKAQFKKEIGSVANESRSLSSEIEAVFSKIDVTKPMTKALLKIDALKKRILTTEKDLDRAAAAGQTSTNSKSVSAMVAEQERLYERLEAARGKLAIEVAAAAQKQAAAEEKAAQREAVAREKSHQKQIHDLTKPVRRFKSRFREIVSGALVFNVISAGLRGVTTYFGSALKANNEFSSSLSQLKGSLMTAFHPIYESALPALLTLMDWLNTAIQVIGRFFAALSGKSYSQMQKNAQALNKQASAIGGVGDAAEKAEKQLMGFDEINKLSSMKSGSGGGNAGTGAPTFDDAEIPSEWETAIGSLAMRVKDIFFEWENLTPEAVAEKMVGALSVITGGLIGFALGGPGGALIGMTIGAGLSVVLSNIIFNGDGALSSDEFLAALVAGLSIIGGAAIGFAIGGPGGALIGATVGLGLTFAILDSTFDDVEKSYDDLAKHIVEWSDLAARTTESGFIIPSHNDFLWLRDKIKEYFSSASNDIIDSFNLAARTTESGFVIPTREEMAATAEWISQKFREAKDGVIDAWHSTTDWFAQNVTEPIAKRFLDMRNNIARFINGAIQGSVEGINSIASAVNKLSFTVPEWVPGIGGARMGFNVGYITSYPQIPYLAQGAVIPPNAPFLAMLGDQRHGNNIEAPESAIYEQARKAVVDVLAQQGNNDRITQLLEILISTVEGIEVGDDVIGKAAARYNRRTSRAGGY